MRILAPLTSFAGLPHALRDFSNRWQTPRPSSPWKNARSSGAYTPVFSGHLVESRSHFIPYLPKRWSHWHVSVGKLPKDVNFADEGFPGPKGWEV